MTRTDLFTPAQKASCARAPCRDSGMGHSDDDQLTGSPFPIWDYGGEAAPRGSDCLKRCSKTISTASKARKKLSWGAPALPRRNRSRCCRGSGAGGAPHGAGAGPVGQEHSSVHERQHFPRFAVGTGGRKTTTRLKQKLAFSFLPPPLQVYISDQSGELLALSQREGKLP